MKKMRILLVLGIWVTVLPQLGFPYSWKNILTTISGLILVYFSYILYKESRTKEVMEEKNFDNFSENKFLDEGEL